MHGDLVEQSGDEGLADRGRAHEAHVPATGRCPCEVHGVGDPCGDEGVRRVAVRQWVRRGVGQDEERCAGERAVAVPAVDQVVGAPAGDDRADPVCEGVEHLRAGSREPEAGLVAAGGVAVGVPVEQPAPAGAEWLLAAVVRA